MRARRKPESSCSTLARASYDTRSGQRATRVAPTRTGRSPVAHAVQGSGESLARIIWRRSESVEIELTAKSAKGAAAVHRRRSAAAAHAERAAKTPPANAARLRDVARVDCLPAGLTDTRALLTALAQHLAFPGYFGFNSDALSDCLRDLHWLTQTRVVVRHADLPSLPEPELRTYLEVLQEAVASWQPGEAHSLHVVFPSNVGQRVTCLLTTDP